MERLYYPYSEYLKNIYHEKVYKLPVNLPLSCPNRVNGRGGCYFCAEQGTGFEPVDGELHKVEQLSVGEQLEKTKEHIAKRYKAKKFIAYFQNYTNTYMPLSLFEKRILEAAAFPDIVEIAVSTRPDCIRKDYLDVLQKAKAEYHVKITIELGLQTVNYHALQEMNRGHSLAEFIDAVLMIKKYGFYICTHMILNLPGTDMADVIESAKILSALSIDIVKLHSLYIAKNTKLCQEYESGRMTVNSKDDYLERVSIFLDYLKPDISVERLFSRIPEKDAVFCNWGYSWWKLRDELEEKMKLNGHFQGKCFQYLNGSGLKSLKE